MSDCSYSRPVATAPSSQPSPHPPLAPSEPRDGPFMLAPQSRPCHRTGRSSGRTETGESERRRLGSFTVHVLLSISNGSIRCASIPHRTFGSSE